MESKTAAHGRATGVAAGTPAEPAEHLLPGLTVDVDEVLQVFRLVWPAAQIHVRPVSAGVAVDLRLGRLSHLILLAPGLASEGAGLRLVREIYKGRLPQMLADAQQSRTLRLAHRAGPAVRP